MTPEAQTPTPVETTRYELHEQPIDCRTDDGCRFSIFQGDEVVILFDAHPRLDARSTAKLVVDALNNHAARATTGGEMGEELAEAVKDLRSFAAVYSNAFFSDTADLLARLARERDQMTRAFSGSQIRASEEHVRCEAAESKLATALAVWSDPAALQANLLRTGALSRMNALHIAGATDYDAVKSELATAQATVAAQRKALEHATDALVIVKSAGVHDSKLTETTKQIVQAALDRCNAATCAAIQAEPAR